jgi:hypothetical protein
MVILKYWNPQLNIGLEDFKNAWQFPQQIKMFTEVQQGRLYFRLMGSSKRISYEQVKKGLIKKQVRIHEWLAF